jgi:hypothetical protein
VGLTQTTPRFWLKAQRRGSLTPSTARRLDGAISGCGSLSRGWPRRRLKVAVVIR